MVCYSYMGSLPAARNYSVVLDIIEHHYTKLNLQLYNTNYCSVSTICLDIFGLSLEPLLVGKSLKITIKLN